MEAENFFLKSNAYFRELREIRSLKENIGEEVCTYPFSWQELRCGRLTDTARWREWFDAKGARAFQGILILLTIREPACLCIPAWIDCGGAFIHGGDYRTLPWVRGGGGDSELCARAEAFLEAHLQDFLDTREWRQFFKLCVQLLEDLSLGEEWKERIVCRELSDQQATVQERFYDTILHEDNSSRLYRNLFSRLETAGKQASLEYESELRSQLQLCRQDQVQDALLEEYTDRVRQMKRAPLIAVTGRDESRVREQILPFWEEVLAGGRYFYNGSSALMLSEEEEEDGKNWYRLLDKAGEEAGQFQEKMNQLLSEVHGSILETGELLKRRVQETELRLQKMQKSLKKRNREIDRLASRKSEWIVFLDSVSGGRYRLAIWQNRLAKKVEGFCGEQDLPVLGGNRNVEEIVGLYDSFIKKKLTELRQRNDIYNEQKEKNNQDKRRIALMETGVASLSKMVEICMGKAERDSVDWEELETASPERLAEVLGDVRRRFQIRTAWTALRCCGGDEQDGDGAGSAGDSQESAADGQKSAGDGAGSAADGQESAADGAGEGSGLLLCGFEELFRRYYRGEQEIDSLDLLVVLDADNIPAEDGILLANFAKRMILLRGDGTWKGGGNNGIRRLLTQKHEIGEMQQKVYCRTETLWDMANEVLSGQIHQERRSL